MAGTLDPRVGTDLGGYHIEAVIGRGGMGVVYRTTDRSLDRRVALKLLTPDYADDEAFRARFLRESKLAASIDHPNIIPVYDAGEIDGTFYLAMRYVEGIDLQQRIRDGALAPRHAVAILTQIASALDAAHSAGLVHRDVKPANILIAVGQGSEGADHAYLTDFGLTKHRGAQSELTKVGGFLGTLDYIAPEQIEGQEVDGRADQYALAAVAVMALTGAPPFPRDSDVAVISAHLHDPPPSLHLRLDDLPFDADAVIGRAMAKSPAERFPTCSAFVVELRRALGVTSTIERPVDVPEPERRLRIGVGLVVGAMVLTAIVALSIGPAGGLPGTTPGSSVGLGSLTASHAEASGSRPADRSADPSADPSAFPTRFEEAALALVPEAIRDTCDRGAGLLDSAAAGFVGKVRLNLGGNPPAPADVSIAPKMPTASLTCRPASGATRVHFLWYQIASGISGRDNAVDYLSLLAPRYGADEGDCAQDDKALSSWSNERPSSGLVVCFRTAPFDGSPWLDWTFADSHMLALATRDDRDYDALYSWFADLRTFLP